MVKKMTEQELKQYKFNNHKEGIIESNVVLWGKKHRAKWALKQTKMFLVGDVLVKRMKGLHVVDEIPVNVEEHEVLIRCYYLIIQPCNNITGKEEGQAMEFKIGTQRQDVELAWTALKRHLMKHADVSREHVEDVIHDKLNYPDCHKFDSYMLKMLGDRGKYKKNIHGNTKYESISMLYYEEAAASKEQK